jgi:hypothetical protein
MSLKESATIGVTPEAPQVMQSLLAFPFEPNEALVDAVGHRGFTIRAADSWGQRSSASMLINRLYARRGYKSNALPDGAEPNRLTLVATDHNAVVGTMTVGFDSDDALLADALFPDEVNALRNAGRQVCEFTKLAIDGLVRSQRVLVAMFHVAFLHAHRIRGCDNLLIEVNPRHTRYYEVKLGFVALGPQRLNHRVNAPAVLMALDLWHAQEQVRKFGGRPELAAEERSLYPLGFSSGEEAGILRRLQMQQDGADRAASERVRPSS